MTDYREYIFHRCDITDLGNKEEATRLAQFLANECLELHRLVTKQEEAMKERLSAKDYEEMSKRVAKELIREDIDGMEDSKFKTFCQENLDKITGTDADFFGLLFGLNKEGDDE